MDAELVDAKRTDEAGKHARWHRLALPLLLLAFLCAACSAADVPPGWVAFNDAEMAVDLDGDGADEQVALADRCVSIQDGSGEATCSTPDDWLVSDVFAGDIDKDGGPELVLVAWKHGSYGIARPFWEDDAPDDELTQHVFILRYENGELQHVWLSSALESEVHVARLDEEGQLHLVDAEGAETVWAWGSFGLKLVGVAGAGPEDVPGASAVTLVAVGDNLVHSSVYENARTPDGDFDFTPIYEPIAGRISSYDIAVVNQETILVSDPVLYGSYPSFGTPVQAGDALVDAGFDVILAATNHATDRGEEGIRETLDFWKQYPAVTLLGIHGDASEPCASYIERNGIRLALFDYTAGLSGPALPEGSTLRVDTLDDEERLLAELAEAEELADVSICFVHIGVDLAEEPSDEQREVATRLIDAGADAVICSHSHVVQPYETVTTLAGNEGIVYYSLGNFMSNQTEPQTTLGMAATLTITKDGAGDACIAEHGAFPIACIVEGAETRVYPLDDYSGERAAELRSQWEQLSIK